MLGVKVSGRTPMAWRIRPGYRGDLVLCDDGKVTAFFAETPIAYEPGMNLQGSAQNRVLCAV